VLSRWNNTIDLAHAKTAGIEGVILKAMDGFNPDPKFVEFVHAAQDAGMPWAPGIKPNLHIDRPEEQAGALWQTVVKVGEPTLEPSIDFDLQGNLTPSTATPQFLATFLRRLVDHLVELGLDPSIYVLDNSWNERVAPAGIDFSDRTMRIADYRGRTPTSPHRLPPPDDPAMWEKWLEPQDPPDRVIGWETWDAWQFSADGNGLGRTLLGPDASADVSINIVKPAAWERWQRN
jgi:GH25 family lysozyme M1 (1,4-beta-N-acetylmuramidase)